ncbi:hypothetical protein [Sphingobacterium thalpophilum]|uniref:hypothetical protein n=1 Tax=Sphingobacterium thalpophilum TaxID=259 RepID=UPI0024A66790|nr:hypothetical protein [Sphingobacterium thalpophilum]
MEDAIKSFVRLMNEKRYLGPFSLIKNNHPLCKNKDLAQCLKMLYSDSAGGGNNVNKYYLETPIVSNRFKHPISCKLYIRDGIGTGIRISRLAVSIAANQPTQYRNYTNNRDLPSSAIIPSLFPKPRLKFDPIDPLKGFRRR